MNILEENHNLDHQLEFLQELRKRLVLLKAFVVFCFVNQMLSLSGCQIVKLKILVFLL